MTARSSHARCAWGTLPLDRCVAASGASAEALITTERPISALIYLFHATCQGLEVPRFAAASAGHVLNYISQIGPRETGPKGCAASEALAGKESPMDAVGAALSWR